MGVLPVLLSWGFREHRGLTRLPPPPSALEAAETVLPECGQTLVKDADRIRRQDPPRAHYQLSFQLPRSPSGSPANARKVSVGLACALICSRTFCVRPIELVNLKNPLSLDGFEGSGGDFPERYNPYLHAANTIVTSQQK